jgi:hypothetical protein
VSVLYWHISASNIHENCTDNRARLWVCNYLLQSKWLASRKQFDGLPNGILLLTFTYCQMRYFSLTFTYLTTEELAVSAQNVSMH